MITSDNRARRTRKTTIIVARGSFKARRRRGPARTRGAPDAEAERRIAAGMNAEI
jgi:hypothetical protein